MLLAYCFGYSYIPFVMRDQLAKVESANQQNNQLGRLLANRDVFVKLVQLMGVVGVCYGLFILKVAKLGFKMNDKRSLAWKAFTVGTPLVFPYLLSFKLEENGRTRKF